MDQSNLVVIMYTNHSSTWPPQPVTYGGVSRTCFSVILTRAWGGHILLNQGFHLISVSGEGE